MAYKDHIMGKGKARVTTRNQEAHDALEKLDWHHGPFKMKGFSYPATPSPITRKVPNCIPKGKLKKEAGDPCWDNYVQRGTKEMK